MSSRESEVDVASRIRGFSHKYEFSGFSITQVNGSVRDSRSRKAAKSFIALELWTLRACCPDKFGRPNGNSELRSGAGSWHPKRTRCAGIGLSLALEQVPHGGAIQTITHFEESTTLARMLRRTAVCSADLVRSVMRVWHFGSWRFHK